MLSCNGLLIEDIRRCSTLFNQLRYYYVKRECNKVAYNLIRYVVHISDFLLWMEYVSPQFFSIVQVDLVFLNKFSLSSSQKKKKKKKNVRCGMLVSMKERERNYDKSYHVGPTNF